MAYLQRSVERAFACLVDKRQFDGPHYHVEGHEYCFTYRKEGIEVTCIYEPGTLPFVSVSRERTRSKLLTYIHVSPPYDPSEYPRHDAMQDLQRRYGCLGGFWSLLYAHEPQEREVERRIIELGEHVCSNIDSLLTEVSGRAV